MTAEIDARLQAAVSSGLFLGLSFVVIDRTGKLIYSGSHGRRSFSSDEPMRLSTSGWLASMTKLMTAVAALHTVQSGLATLDEDLADVLPELRTKEVLSSYDAEKKVASWEPLKAKITLRRLLTHSAGFVYGPFLTRLTQWAVDNNQSIGKLVGDFKKDWDRPMAFQPGTSWGYGEGLDWAGKVVERVSGKSLEEYLEQYVWTPLGMKGTTFHPEKRDTSSYPLLEMGKRASGPGSKLEFFATGQHYYPVPSVNEAGGGGLFSNAEDYAKFLSALLRDDDDDEEDDGVIILKKKMLEELCKPQLNEAGNKALKEQRQTWVLQEIPQEVSVDYALGGLVTTEDSPGGRPKGTVAWDGYSNSNWLLDRETGIGMVLICQVLPEDLDTKKLWSALEKDFYSLFRK